MPGRIRRRFSVSSVLAFPLALLLVGAAAAIGQLLRSVVADIEVLFVFAVAGAAILWGRPAALLAAGAAALLYTFLFVAPHYTLSVDDPRYFATFALMAVAAAAVGTLGDRLRAQERRARAAEERANILYALTERLTALATRESVTAAVAEHVGRTFGAPAHVSEAEADGVCSLRVDRPLEPDERALLAEIERRTNLKLERLELESEAAAAKVRANTETLRSSLLSAVSHDLRTPLATITGAATTLRDESSLDASARRSLIDAVCSEADRLERLVANLLEMTRLEAKVLGPKRTPVPFDELVGSALARLDAALGDRPVTVEDHGTPALHVDPVLFSLVLVNLVENAIKHTPARDAIEIHGYPGSGSVTLDISDRGPGIRPGDEARVFEKFYRDPTSSSIGTGLGLAVARGIVETHGGTLVALQRDGGGTTMRIELPT